jgi:hypothetical protein
MRTKMWTERGLAVLLVFAMALTMLPALGAPALAAPAELFFSEYIEGSSNNKALEIYNGTGAAVDLVAGGYDIQMFFNGSASAGLTITLTGTVADGDVYVVANSSANATILAQADQTNGSGWYSGDDAVVLRKGATIIDAIGQIGFDPGAEWGTGLVSTADNTLRRMATVCAGDPDGSNVFDPAVEWDGYAQDTFDGLGTHAASCGPRALVINEFSASTTGTDVEYVEVYGEPDTDYSVYRILEIEGDAGTAVGTVDEVIAVGTTNAGGLWLGSLPANALENGTITLLLVKDFVGAAGNDLDSDNDGVFDVTPWSEIVDAVAVNDGGAGDVTYGVPTLGVSYDGLPLAPGGASRIPDGFDTDAATDWVRNDFDLAGIPGNAGSILPGEAYNTPGAPNAVYVPPAEVCGDPFTPVYAIQGSGPASPLVGTEVALEGIVVGDFQNNATPDNGNLRGFYVQDPTGDADPATSDGIFVYGAATDGVEVAIGDQVRVRGAVSEYRLPSSDPSTMTEVTASLIWVCSTGNPVPAPATLSLPVASLDDFEPFEGMLVTFPQALVISEYFNFDRYNEIVLTSERLNQPTAVYEPGSPEAIALAELNLRSRIMLDDGRTTQNSDPAIHPNGLTFDLTNLFRGGDTLTNVTGVVDYSYGIYRIQPTQGADYAAVNLRTDTPDDTGGRLNVASFNVLNYFTTIDTGAPICGPAGDQDCRGADTADELARQRAKIIAALAAMNADVVGLIEIENHPGDVPTADLVDGLNAATAPGTYDYIATGAIGIDAIRQAFIFKPATVSLVGVYAVLDDPSFTDPLSYGEQKSRPALAQTFRDNTSGGKFTVVVNHLKSKGSACGEGDDDPWQGNCNLTRTLGAQALVDWLATDPTGGGDPDVLVIGDLNAYDKEDPVDALVAGGYTDIVAQFLGENAYSYVYDGQVGYLDHALAGVNNSLAGEVTGVTVWHINADEPDLIDYDMTFKLPAQDALWAPDAYRSSDHDPVIIGLNPSPLDVRCWFPIIFR